MKIIKEAIPFVLVILMFATYSCAPDEDAVLEALNNKIEELHTDIELHIENSTGQTSADCRTRYITGGHDCGTYYIYGIEGIDTVRLEHLFDQLLKAKTERFKIRGGPYCSMVAPTKDSLINNQCKICYGDVETNQFECF
ncbi:MAG: hypothetical protein AAFO69_05210 [Bacteroidota bacterium]